MSPVLVQKNNDMLKLLICAVVTNIYFHELLANIYFDDKQLVSPVLVQKNNDMLKLLKNVPSVCTVYCVTV